MGERIKQLGHRMSEMFSRETKEVAATAVGMSSRLRFRPVCDLRYRGPDKMVLSCEMAGLTPADVDIMVHEHRIIISGDKRKDLTESDEVYEWEERSHGKFLRSIPLPDGALPSGITAYWREGILEIFVPISRELSRREPLRVRINEAMYSGTSSYIPSSISPNIVSGGYGSTATSVGGTTTSNIVGSGLTPTLGTSASLSALSPPPPINPPVLSTAASMGALSSPPGLTTPGLSTTPSLSALASPPSLTTPGLSIPTGTTTYSNPALSLGTSPTSELPKTSTFEATTAGLGRTGLEQQYASQTYESNLGLGRAGLEPTGLGRTGLEPTGLGLTSPTTQQYESTTSNLSRAQTYESGPSNLGLGRTGLEPTGLGRTGLEPTGLGLTSPTTGVGLSNLPSTQQYESNLSRAQTYESPSNLGLGRTGLEPSGLGLGATGIPRTQVYESGPSNLGLGRTGLEPTGLGLTSPTTQQYESTASNLSRAQTYESGPSNLGLGRTGLEPTGLGLGRTGLESTGLGLTSPTTGFGSTVLPGSQTYESSSISRAPAYEAVPSNITRAQTYESGSSNLGLGRSPLESTGLGLGQTSPTGIGSNLANLEYGAPSGVNMISPATTPGVTSPVAPAAPGLGVSEQPGHTEVFPTNK